MTKKRKSYTLHQKLEIVREFDVLDEEGNPPSVTSLALKHNVDRKSIREWKEDREKFEAVLKAHDKSIKRVRRVGNAGPKTPFQAVETQLLQWTKEQNEKGLIVKDKYLKAKSLKIARALNIGVEQFKASEGFIANFKRRNNLVSRAHTTTRTLPDDAKEKAYDFINSTRNLICQLKIKKENILNFDQVPRYFEHSSKHR